MILAVLVIHYSRIKERKAIMSIHEVYTSFKEHMTQFFDSKESII